MTSRIGQAFAPTTAASVERRYSGSIGSPRTVALAWTLGGCALIAIGACVRVYLPGTTVPLTLQSLALLLLGLGAPATPAAAAALLYVLLGAAGLPIFAGSGGLLGETGGYLIGFAPAVWIMSQLRGGPGASFQRMVCAGFAGLTVLFVMGPLWLVLVHQFGLAVAFATGAVPFLFKAAVEVPLAAGIVSQARGWRNTKKTRT